MTETSWPKIAVMGAGAVGCYFGGMLARAGASVTLIGRARHVEPIQRNGLCFDGIRFQERIRIGASLEPSSASDAGLVLLCVKSFDTESAARSLAPHLLPNAVVLSLQNGIDNVERIRAAAGIRALPAIVYVAAEMIGPGRVKHNGRGDLVIGQRASDGEAERGLLQRIARDFERAGIPCRISGQMNRELWTKMLVNCAYNALSAITRSCYSRLAENPWTRQMIVQTVSESLAVARAAGVQLDEAEMVQAGLEIANTMASAISSMAQDLARGARTEIDSLNGYVARRGAELGIPTPINQTLHALIKLLEENTQNEHSAVYRVAGPHNR